MKLPLFPAVHELEAAYEAENEWVFAALEFGLYRREDLAQGRQTLMYFVQHPDGPIKIGTSREPEKRISNLRVGIPSEGQLRLLCYVPATAELERWIHRLLKEYRRSGEWYEPEPRVLATVCVFLSAAQVLHDYDEEDELETGDTLACVGWRLDAAHDDLLEKVRG